MRKKFLKASQFLLVVAGLMMLWALARCIVAQLANNDEEIGVGLDHAKVGARWFWLSIFTFFLSIDLRMLGKMKWRKNEG